MSELEGNSIRKARVTVEQIAPRSGSGFVEPSSSPVLDPVCPEGYVRVRVMKKGDRRIFTGVTCMLEEEKFPTFRKGDELNLPRASADKYEDDGWVEILHA